MLVRRGERIELEAPAMPEAADDLVMNDYYTRLPQLRLTGGPTDRTTPPPAPTEIILDGGDVGRHVECTVRHPYCEYASRRAGGDLEPSRFVLPKLSLRP
jgi:hypothetical protein